MRTSTKRNRRYRQRNREYVHNYLLKNPCVDCGETNPIVLEFDHITDNKNGNISRLVQTSASLKTIQREIDKCEVACSNCHKVRTAGRGNFYSHRRQQNDDNDTFDIGDGRINNN